ncbi:MAG: SDR family NAD(P)-dependent oxidoreductase [Pseudomonadota bacterium]
MQRSILITGCSSGIGHDAAHALKARGWRVFATCRKAEDCARLRGEGLESFVLDYADATTIEAAVAEVLGRTEGTLDALFNNGAYAVPGAVEDLPRDALRAIFEVNLFGYFDLIGRVLPVMRARGKGRIVNCSSILGFTALKWRGAYNATKFAMEGLTDTLRLEMRDAPIDIVLIEPGPIATRIRRNSIPHFEKWIDWEHSARREQYETQIMPHLYGDHGSGLFELPPAAVTRKLIHALEVSRPKARYFVTTPTYLMYWTKRLMPLAVFDWLTARG